MTHSPQRAASQGAHITARTGTPFTGPAFVYAFLMGDATRVSLGSGKGTSAVLAVCRLEGALIHGALDHIHGSNGVACWQAGAAAEAGRRRR